MNLFKLVLNIIAHKYKISLKGKQDEIDAFQYKTKEEIQTYQIEKIRELLIHAYEQTDHYKALFDKIDFDPREFSSLDELERIPVTSKEDIKADFEAFVAKNREMYHGRHYHTGGTTGVAFKYLLDRRNWLYNWFSLFRAYEWLGYTMGKDKIGMLAGGSIVNEGDRGIQRKLWMKILKYYPLSITLLTEEKMEAFTKLMRRKKIRFIRGYPTAVYTYAKYLEDHNERLPLNGVMTTAEMLFPYQRELIESVFMCPVYDQYGCKDGTLNACECEQHSGLHISPEISYLEVVKDDPKDQYGNVAVTSLWNYSMPFIRYMPGDLAESISDGCSCGRNLPKLKGLMGRSSDIIRFSNGNTLNGLSIPFEDHDDLIHQFQIVETDQDKLEIRLVKKEGFSQEDEDMIMRSLKAQIGEGVEITIKYVDEIELPKSNKFRYVIAKD